MSENSTLKFPDGWRERAAGYGQAVALRDAELITCYHKALGRKVCLQLAAANIQVLAGVVADQSKITVAEVMDRNIAAARGLDQIEASILKTVQDAKLVAQVS